MNRAVFKSLCYGTVIQLYIHESSAANWSSHTWLATLLYDLVVGYHRLGVSHRRL